MTKAKGFSNDIELYPRHFSKSLTNQAYTWYLNLNPGSIQDLDIVSFNIKFFSAETNYPGHNLDLSVKIFHVNVLDYNNPIDEEVLVNICLRGMDN